MNPFLIVHSELVCSARRMRYFLVRFSYGSILFLAICINYVTEFGMRGSQTVQSAAAFAASFLQTFAFLQLCAVVLLGPALLAGGIARERQRRTIEYLFTTHLTNLEIVLGKLIAGLVQLLACLVTGLPILSLAMLLGGIDPDALLLAFLIALSTSVAVGGLSMAVSVAARRARDAVSTVYLMLFALLGVPWLVGLLLQSLGVGWFSDATDALMAWNPFAVLFSVIITPTWSGTSVPVSPVWWMAGGHLVFAVGCVAAATWLLRRVPVRAAVATRTAMPISARRRRPIGNYPMLWKELYATRATTRAALASRVFTGLLLAVVVVATIVYFTTAVVSGQQAIFIWYTMIAGTGIACFALLFLATRSSNAIAGEREQQTWDGLMSTPLTAREILMGKMAGQLYNVRGMGLALALIWILQSVLEPRFLLAVPILLTELSVFALAAGALGMACSLQCRTATRALGATLAIVLVLGSGCCPVSCLLPSPISLLSMPVMLFVDEHIEYEVVLIYGAIFALGLLVYLGAGVGLYFACERGFDRLGGRMHPTAPTPIPPMLLCRRR